MDNKDNIPVMDFGQEILDTIMYIINDDNKKKKKKKKKII